MLDEGVEIAVGVQQRNAVEDAAGGDKGVDGLSRRDAQTAQELIMACGQSGDLMIGDADRPEGRKEIGDLCHVPGIPCALKQFHKHQITDSQRCAGAKQTAHLGDLDRRAVPQQVDPDAGVEKR